MKNTIVILLAVFFVPTVATAEEGVEYLRYTIPRTNLTDIADFFRTTITRLLELNPSGRMLLPFLIMSVVIVGAIIGVWLTLRESAKKTALVAELVGKYEGTISDLGTLNVKNSRLRMRIHDLVLEKYRLGEEVKVKSFNLSEADRRIEAFKSNIIYLCTADGLREFAQGITVGELVRFFDTPTFGVGDECQTELKKIKEVLDDLVKRRCLSGTATCAVEAMTLERFLSYLKRGGIVEI
ncbi:MAG: hypothetical protein A3C07_01315 [Candidatus Sungbacteria bacterium RIFCSPHIGHO2_02_FULL_47_11]|uniref:Uncharacterized protein n=1 Tax=Candidatus Sungbacteria bacterium RIFCSPHIGHO2_02_FULL_47_11 TaxID=1802270 RepID=A0A1G2KLA8_9BACT|nr:MAG: hypothetical protein A3C07_01315 [Candidatus Sungbacteria bacterium RIFCSPHIGHO2_02_FULL_47_11]